LPIWWTSQWGFRICFQNFRNFCGSGGDSDGKYAKATVKQRNNNDKKKKQNRAKKKKKSGNLLKRAQKIFERDPTKKNFCVSETIRGAKGKNHELKFVI
jgi:hypothetical protein